MPGPVRGSFGDLYLDLDDAGEASGSGNWSRTSGHGGNAENFQIGLANPSGTGSATQYSLPQYSSTSSSGGRPFACPARCDRCPRNMLAMKAFARQLFLLFAMAALLFTLAGTLHYWQA